MRVCLKHLKKLMKINTNIFSRNFFDKNLLNDDRLGNRDLQTNLKVHNYDTNKLKIFL